MWRWQRVDVGKGDGGGVETVVAKAMVRWRLDGGLEAASCLYISAKRPRAFRACIRVYCALFFLRESSVILAALGGRHSQQTT